MANNNKSDYGVGRLLVEEESSECLGIKNDRTRFEIELKQGETTIVSWTQLLKDSGFPVPNALKRPYQEDDSRSKCSNITVKKETDEQNYCQPKKQRKKMVHARAKSITLTSDISEEHLLNNARIELPDLNVPYKVQAQSTLPTHIEVKSESMVNGSMLENAILEMETMVADTKRLNGGSQDVDHSVATTSRLPPELKQKLEIVAKLARCLRDMVPCDLSACGGDAVRFDQIKKEVVKMIKVRSPSMDTKDELDNETMELHATYKEKYSMDHEMEDKICDFYDIYLQGMNEIKSSEIRRFYVQVAALWPKGSMDNHGIRNAICRSKERRRTAFEDKGHEKGKRKKSLNTGMDEDLHGEAKLGSDPERRENNTNSITFLDTVVPGTPELDQSLRASVKRFSPLSASSCHDLLQTGEI